jgi:hypothetical protein
MTVQINGHGFMVYLMIPPHNGSLVKGKMVRSPPKILILDNKYACLQLDTCHVGSYSDTLVPLFRT